MSDDLQPSTIWPGPPISRRLDDGRILTVTAELFGARLLIDDNRAMHERSRLTGEPTESDGGADFYFQYQTYARAIEAMSAMTVDDLEPDGWIRAAPPQYRRRPDGDRRREHIRP